MADEIVELVGDSMSHEALEPIAAGLLMVGFPGPSVPADTAKLIDHGVRNFILFARNIEDAEQVRTLNAQLRSRAGDDALIAIDHEGGKVNRLGDVSTPWPSPMAWAATGDVELVRRASAAAARELAALGFNLNFAPVADILGNYHNPVLGVRCFSDDPQTVAEYLSAFIDGHHRGNMAATAKHFPGHGGTAVDSHVDMPEVDLTVEVLQRNDLVPFRTAIEAGVDCLMISHIWYSGLDHQSTPATLSKRVMQLARQELGYRGVIVTDCMEMGAIQNRMTTSEAVVASIAAGADLAIVSHRIELQQQALAALVHAIRCGALPLSRVMEANRRLAALRAHESSAEGSPPDRGGELASDIARQSITLVRDAHAYVPLQMADEVPLGVVTFSRERPTGIDNGQDQPSQLSELVRGYRARVIEVQVDDFTPDSWLALLHEADTVLVGTSFATGHPMQRDVVDALARAEKRVIVLALSDPYDLLSFPDAPCYLALYGDTPYQLGAALAVVFGVAEARGRMPVTLGELYPRHHGTRSFAP